MNSKEISQGIILSIFKLGLIFICIWLLIQLKSLIIYIVISVVISLIGRPINRFLLNKLKLGKIFSSTLTIIILLSFFFLITNFLLVTSRHCILKSMCQSFHGAKKMMLLPWQLWHTNMFT